MSKTPEPKWRRQSKDGNIEIRLYDPMIIAEVTVAGERRDAIRAGFRMLAGYIFGGNSKQQKISMTAPVLQEAENPNWMNGAVQAGAKQTATQNQNEWKVGFVMPPEFSLESLPKPNEQQIRFLELPSQKAAVILFSGMNTDKNLAVHQEKLVAWLWKNNIHPIGVPVYAFYNPPWTLPFLRRNEIIIHIPY
jgi:hypothetical protein